MGLMTFVPARVGGHIHINETYSLPHVTTHSSSSSAAAAVANLDPVADYITLLILASYIFAGTVVWFWGPDADNGDEAEVRRRIGQAIAFRVGGGGGDSRFTGPELWPWLVNLVLVVMWPLVLPLWLTVVIDRRAEERKLREYEEAMARAMKRSMAGAETGKCRMPLPL